MRRHRVIASLLAASLAAVLPCLGAASASVVSESEANAARAPHLRAHPAAPTLTPGMPELPESVPADAVFLVAKHDGQGDSGRLRFRAPRSGLFTVAFACEGRRAEVGIVVRGRATRLRCGVPHSSTVLDHRARQWVQVEAPRSVSWVMAVYKGTPAKASGG